MEAILCTCSPDLERYKEFVNNGADRIFMPLYTKAELLIIGRCIAKCDVDDKDTCFYSILGK